MAAVPVLPPELLPHRAAVQTYATQRVKQFAYAFSHRIAPQLAGPQLELLINETLAGIQHQDPGPQRALRLVLRHDCQSTGCGETGCLLCQCNPSRLCKRNLKAKYLIDDHLKAKCGAPLRVELVDDTGACVMEGLPPGMQLEIHVLNGEKYKEICPENTLLTHAQLKSCIISHHTKALLKRDGGSDEQLRCFLQLERGQAALSDLQVTTSSEALLAGKAPTFRLLVWAVDMHGEPVASVTYVVSEFFVVATKRVKHAIKSDIPSVADHVSKLVHIGKATVDKLMDLRQAATDEGFELNVPDEMNRVDKVGIFQQLVELCEVNTDVKNKVRHLLKLSPEKWEEVAAHAQAAVMPDFRPRVWWCPPVKAGLLFSCKNGSVCMDTPIALVKMSGKDQEDQIIPISQLDPQLFSTVPKLKASAVQSWYLAQHPGWAIYWKEGQQDPTIMAAVSREQQAAGQPPGLASAAPALPLSGLPVGARMGASTSNAGALNGGGPASAFALSNPGMLGGPGVGASATGAGMGGGMPKQSPFQVLPGHSGLPPTSGAPSGVNGLLQPVAPLVVNQGQGMAGSQSVSAANGGRAGGVGHSPFAAPTLMGNLASEFPAHVAGQQAGAGGVSTGGAAQGPQGVGVSDSLGLSLLPGMNTSSLMAAAAAGLAGPPAPSNGHPGGHPGAGAHSGAHHPAANGGGGPSLETLKTEDLPNALVGGTGGMDRGLSQYGSLLAPGDGPLVFGGQAGLPPHLLAAGGLGGSGSLGGSLNQAVNAMIQESLDRQHSGEPPLKMPRLEAATATVGGDA